MPPSAAQVGVVFYLDDLKEVSQQTDDRVKVQPRHNLGHNLGDDLRCNARGDPGTVSA